ncbi:MAG TPA: ATP phosphoribosyltransferase [Patescibacteria group bacterium]|nr:ATP phosphoribosyltransferase [Patescibacteria group bacterium]
MNKNILLNREDYTKIAIPKGELLGDLLGYFSDAGCETKEFVPKSLVFEFPFLALPLLLVALRSRDIGQTISDPDSDIYFGFVGSDIAEEQNLEVTSQLPPEAMQAAKLVMGSTPNFREKVPKSKNMRNISAVKNASICTPYPNITKKYLAEKGIDARVIEKQGAIEAYWWAYPSCEAIVDVVISGTTMRANLIEPMEIVRNDLSVQSVRATDERAFNEVSGSQFNRDFNVLWDFQQILNKKKTIRRK